MKKFTSYEENKEESTDINNFVDKLLKENISLEITGEEKPWVGEIDIKANEELVIELKTYIEQEISKSNLHLLEKMKLSYYKNTTLDSIDDEIKKIREKLRK